MFIRLWQRIKNGWIRKWYLRSFLNTKVWHYTNIFGSAKIGRNCVIGSYTEIGDGVVIGDGCKIEAMVFIPKGVVIGNNVFLGPGVRFTNDKYPKAVGEWKVWNTEVGNGASIGAGTTVICGVKIGENACVGAGAVVTKDVPDGVVVYGIPAREADSVWGVKK